MNSHEIKHCCVRVKKLTQSQITRWTTSTSKLPVSCLESILSKKKARKEFKCAVCEKVFGKMDNLKSHSRTHTGEKPFSCLQCHSSFRRTDTLKLHMKRLHNIGDGVKCNVCSKEFPNTNLLRIHLSSHLNERSHSCLFCNKKFKSTSNLYIHYHTHINERPFSCKVCKRSFAFERNCTLHVQTIHTTKKLHKCRECPAAFRGKSYLQKHVNFVHRNIRPYPCTVCGQRFATSSRQAEHMTSHTNEQPHKCKKCGRRYSTYPGLRLHPKHHDTKANLYSCPRCFKVYTKQVTLERHYLSEHIGVRINFLQCLFCEHACRDTEQFNFHIARHTNERAYFCDVCPKAFYTNSNLRIHSKTHKNVNQ